MARATRDQLNGELATLGAKFTSKLAELAAHSSSGNSAGVKRVLDLLKSTSTVAYDSVANMQSMAGIQGVSGDQLMDFSYRALQRMNKEFDIQVEKLNEELEKSEEVEDKSKEVSGKLANTTRSSRVGAVSASNPVAFPADGLLVAKEVEGQAAKARQVSKAEAKKSGMGDVIDKCSQVPQFPSQLADAFSSFDVPNPPSNLANFDSDVFNF